MGARTVVLTAAALALTGCAATVHGTALPPVDEARLVELDHEPAVLTPDGGSGTHAVVPDGEGAPTVVDIGPLEDGGGAASVDVVEDRTAPSVGLPVDAATAADGDVVLVGIPHPGDPLRLRVARVTPDGAAGEPTTVDLGAGARFVETAVSADGGTLYALTADDDGAVELLAADPATGTVTARVPVATYGPAQPRDLVVRPDGWVVAALEVGDSAVVTEFDATLTQRGEPIGVGSDQPSSPLGLALLPDGETLVSVAVGDGIELVAVAADLVEDVARIEAEPADTAVPVLAGGSVHVPVATPDGPAVAVVDAATGRVTTQPLCADGRISSIAPAADGSFVYLGGTCGARPVVWVVS